MRIVRCLPRMRGGRRCPAILLSLTGMRKGLLALLGIFGMVLLLAGCRQGKVPEVYTDVKQAPAIYPDYHRQLLKSYNVPELMKGPVSISPHTFADVLRQEALILKSHR